MRICSLLPSATEIAFALGLGDQIFGVTHECDYPPEAKEKPIVVRTLIEPEKLSSAAIDNWVRDRLATQRSLYTIDATAFEKASPDIILTQDLCDVCAIATDDVTDACKLLPHKPTIVSLAPTSLDDVLRDIERVGDATNRQAEARALVQQLQQRIEKVRVKVSAAQFHPRVACLEWLDPLYSAGHWVPEMVQLAGGQDGLASAGEPSARVEWEKVLAFAPEVIVLMPCGFKVERAKEESASLHERSGWTEVPAVRNGQVFAVDGQAYFNRPGPRLIDGLEILAQIIHPELFPWSAPPQAVQKLL